MATFNRGRHILPSIESALYQTEQDFELLVIGDAVTDETAEVVKSIGSKKIKWKNLEERTGSQSGPNNQGIRNAKGTYIAYLSHDDVWARNHLAELRSTFEDFDAEFVYSGTFRHPHPGQGAKIWSYGMNPRGICHDRPHVPPSGFSHRRDVMNKIEYWPDVGVFNHPIDMHFQTVAREAGLRFAATGQPTAHKYLASQSYLSYLLPDSDGQKWLLSTLSQDPIPQEFENKIKDAALNGKAGLKLFNSAKDPLKKVDRPTQRIKARDLLRGLIPAPIPLTSRAIIKMTREGRGKDWAEMLEHHTGYRQSGPSEKPRLLIPFTGSSAVEIEVEILAQNKQQIRALTIWLNDDLVDFSFNGQMKTKTHYRATLSMLGNLRSDKSSVITIDQSEAINHAKADEPFSMVAAGTIIVTPAHRRKDRVSRLLYALQDSFPKIEILNKQIKPFRKSKH